MNGDITRSTFDASKQYTSVRHQQGRVVLDADLNERTDLELFDARQARIDIIGQSGAPEGNAGLEITADSAGITIGAGRFYVDGMRVDFPETLAFEQQPHAPELPASDGLYVALLRAWERPIDAISDPRIREVALGGPDTATRTQLVARVELLAVESEAAPSCASSFPAWDRLLAGSTAKLRVRLAAGSSDDPCSIPEHAGYRGLENQLYRLEVHAGNFDPQRADSLDPAATATFKWSRDNGAIVAAFTAQESTLELAIDRLGPGGTNGFEHRPWVELTDARNEANRTPGLLATIADVGDTTITLADELGDVAAALAGTFDPSAMPRVRRWDSKGARPLAVAPSELGSGDVTADGWIRLEAGIEVQFEPGAVQCGDYWLLPARTAALPGSEGRQLEWPLDPATNEYAARFPDGHAQHFARLALLRRSGGSWSVLEDCRALFPPLTDLPEPVFGTGCGEIVVEVGADVRKALRELGLARIGSSGELLPGSVSALRLCFRPGEHEIGNLAFSGFAMLSLGGIGAGASLLRGRIRVTECADVAIRDLQLSDTNADASRIVAPDDQLRNQQHRWRTRALEVRSASDVAIERVAVDFYDPRWRLKDGQAIHISAARDVRIRDCVVRVPRGQNGIRIQNVERVIVEHNRVEQDWGAPLRLGELTSAERAELGSWVGRLLVDLHRVTSRAAPFVAVTKGVLNTSYDRGAFRFGLGTPGERYWAGETTVLAFLTQAPGSEDVRASLASAAAVMANSLANALALSTLIPRGTSTSAGDLSTVRVAIEKALQARRAEYGRRLITDGAIRLPQHLSLRQRMVAEGGRWLLGLGGSGIRVAMDGARKSAESVIRISHNHVLDFAVGIEATLRQNRVGDARIQRIDVCDNSLRLRSPLIPVQRGGIIAGGACRVRIDGNDIDVLEGSSQRLQPSRGWYVGVDGIRVRGALGAWVGVRDNQLRGCAVGIRRVGDSKLEEGEDTTLVRALADNAFLACDTNEIWFST